MTDLRKSKLFSGIPEIELQAALESVSIRVQKYSRSEIIAFEGDPCTSIGILLFGELSIQKLLPSGNKIVIDSLQAGESFGEVVVFSDHANFPASIEAVEAAQIAFISKENVMLLCNLSPRFLLNFVGLLSNKILMLNRKVKSLSLQSPRQKTINYILEQFHQQSSLLIKCEDSRFEMAEKLGLPRPSLSRELSKLRARGWIDFDGRTIKILNLEALNENLAQRSRKI
ncbi:MAG: Crp/Fnr family transcriptional regulator [Anaerolineaceae bacterium]